MRAPPFLLHELIARAPSAEAFAVGHGKERLSYGELDRLSDRVAAYLQKLGVKPGDRVALYQPKSIRGVIELFAILKCGAAYVPIDPGAPPDRARFILEHCGIEVLFSAGRPKRALGAELGGRALFATDDDALFRELEDGPDRFAPPNVTDTSLAYVLYTSGSTGTPKGVAITHAQSLTFVRAATEVFAMTAADVTASHAPFNFDLSIIDLFCTFLAGGRMEIIPETWLAFPARIGKLIEEAKISVWNSVPSALIKLAEHGALGERELSSLRLVMFAGEPFPIRPLRTLAAAVPSAKLLNVYGQTEANSSTYFAIETIPADDGAVLPAGKTFPNYDVLLLGADGRAISAPNVEGELYVAGGAVASGYFRDPERTAAAFVQHPLRSGAREVVYKTGDRFSFDERGELIFRGRMDSAVKVRGFRVELGEVEAVLAAAPGIAESAIIALPDEATGHALIAFVVPRAPGALDEVELERLIVAKLPRYMLPSSFVSLGALPRTPNGKIDRRALFDVAKQAGEETLDAFPGPG